MNLAKHERTSSSLLLFFHWMCCYETSYTRLFFPPVGNTFHDPRRLHREQPDHFLHGVGGCRRERGRCFPLALVGTSTETPPRIPVNIVVFVVLLIQRVFFVLAGQCFPMWWMTSRCRTQTCKVTKPSSSPSTCSS